MKDFDRYGVVDLNEDHSVRSFREKKYYENGLINGGVYSLNVVAFLKEELPERFSFEKEYLEKKINNKKENLKIYGLIQDEYFIDIGIPEDYKKAEKEFKSL